MAGDSKDVIERMPQRLRDFIDLSNEMAGRDTGRIKRFLTSGESTFQTEEKKKEQRLTDALLRLMQNREYAQLYTDTVSALDRARQAADTATAKLIVESSRAFVRVEAPKAAAGELPDGRKVFRSNDGRLIAEDGADVSAGQDQVIGLFADMASWEDFVDAKRVDADLRQRIESIAAYREEVLEQVEQRLRDADNPPELDEHKELSRKIDEAMPEDVKRFLNRGEPAPGNRTVKAAADDIAPAKGVSGPDMFAQFQTVSANVIPADAFGPPGSAPKAKL